MWVKRDGTVAVHAGIVRDLHSYARALATMRVAELPRLMFAPATGFPLTI
jgi:hypothetical protein